ncbi:MAG: S41 family peptidase, partial [Kangiellaceae bacterium]|jgi:carboxyl-terminal processing protease|nr:S41 family peptidase [Kangiellaceae bacterium]
VFNLVREKLTINSVELSDLGDGYWHIELSMFQRDTGFELARLMQRTVKDKSLKGIVLDLRDNPGGVLRAAVDVSDLILRNGIIVSTEGRGPEEKEYYFANPGDILEQVPAVVLINKNSASASEIVAAALQDHKRALIAGEPSYGKGLVQTILPLQHNAAIKLTTSRYYSPDGRTIQGKGVQPDVLLAAAEPKPGSTEKSLATGGDQALNQALELLKDPSQFKL